VTKRLTVAVVLTSVQNPSSGECRLLEALGQDARFDLALFTAGDPSAAKLPLAISGLLAIERAGLGVLRKTSGFTCEVADPQPLDQISPTPDVIIDFSGLEVVETFAASARFGMWRLDAYANGAGLDAVFQGKTSTPVSLLRYPGDARSADTLARTVYDTKPLATMNALYIQEKSVQLIERELARLTIDDACVPHGPAHDSFVASPVVPGTAALARYLVLTCTGIAGRVWVALKARLGLRPQMFALRVGSGSGGNFDPAKTVEIPTEGNHFLADPFLFENDGETFLFFEDYSYETKLGHIGVGKLTGTEFKLIGPAYTAPHHLSYPFVFRQGGDIFMIPETYQAGRIEVWRATDFPTGWELYSTALQGVSAVDSVLTEIDGVWWLFTNICRDSFGDFCSELHIFRTDGPAMTRVEPHRMNPVVIGSDTARGAGRVFCQDGQWLRSSQDNSGGDYGYGLNIMAIEQLDIDHYRERRIRHITPDFAPGLIGCHHFDTAGGQFVIDVRKS
jgi:hypothetical protein